MADTFSKSKRSETMAAVKSRGNKATELRLIAIFRAHGLKGWRRHGRLPGKPDFILPQARLAIFVDGCFWHGCPRHCRMPSTRVEYWGPKIARNRKRDAAVRRLLRQKGWNVFRIWEHRLKNPSRLMARLHLILRKAEPPAKPKPRSVFSDANQSDKKSP